jgi:hypothetical protein
MLQFGQMDENTRLRRTIWRFIRPGGEEIILYSLIATIIFVLSLYNVANTGGLNVDTQELLQLLRQAANVAVLAVATAIGGNKLLLFGFWFLIGAVVYMLLWFLANIAIDTYNDIVISAVFVHPESFHQSQYWMAIGARFVLRAAAGIALLIYAFFWVKALLPTWEYAFKVTLSKLSFAGVINGVTTFVSIVLTLHLCTILFRIMLLSSGSPEEE